MSEISPAKQWLRELGRFVSRHKWFTLFFGVTLTANTLLLVNSAGKSTRYISCSTFDRGPLGTFGLYTYLAEQGIGLSRMKMSPLKELDPERDQGKTLVILSPRFSVHAWEWQRIVRWVAAGNRLITAGFRLPINIWESGYILVQSTKLVPDSLAVALPVDTVFPYPERLPPLPTVDELLQDTWVKDSAKARRTPTVVLNHAGMLPLLTADTSVVAAKRLVGEGEWVIFPYTNPFSNALLTNGKWFRFACKLLTADGRYARGKLLFDEYHNGYRATKSFWELLSYYEFTTGIVFVSSLLLLYLFFTGLRILPPHPRTTPPSRDIVPGLRSVASLFDRFGAHPLLLQREMRLIETSLVGSAAAGSADPADVARAYLEYGTLPPMAGSAEELAERIGTIRQLDKNYPRNRYRELFNLLAYMRKELER